VLCHSLIFGYVAANLQRALPPRDDAGVRSRTYYSGRAIDYLRLISFLISTDVFLMMYATLANPEWTSGLVKGDDAEVDRIFGPELL
jgi:hypothetical protein